MTISPGERQAIPHSVRFVANLRLRLHSPDVTTSSASDPQPVWWYTGDVFHSAGSFDQAMFDMPDDNGEPSRRVGEMSCADRSTQRGSSPGTSRKKGSVTLTLSQVNPDVAHEIMGSVLKHSSELKIRCIIEDS
jgi:hypothetical protein